MIILCIRMFCKVLRVKFYMLDLQINVFFVQIKAKASPIIMPPLQTQRIFIMYLIITIISSLLIFILALPLQHNYILRLILLFRNYIINPKRDNQMQKIKRQIVKLTYLESNTLNLCKNKRFEKLQVQKNGEESSISYIQSPRDNKLKSYLCDFQSENKERKVYQQSQLKSIQKLYQQSLKNGIANRQKQIFGSLKRRKSTLQKTISPLLLQILNKYEEKCLERHQSITERNKKIRKRVYSQINFHSPELLYLLSPEKRNLGPNKKDFSLKATKLPLIENLQIKNNSSSIHFQKRKELYKYRQQKYPKISLQKSVSIQHQEQKQKLSAWQSPQLLSDL